MGARLRLDRPISGIGLVRAVKKQRAMEESGDSQSLGIAHDRIEPVGLTRLLALAAAEEHGIEPDQAAVLDILDPPVRTEMGTPAPEPLFTDWLAVVTRISDIMVAGHRAKPHAQTVHQLSGIPQILFDIRPVHGDVPRMDDEVGALLDDPTGERRPVVGEMHLAWAQMRVGDLNYPHRPSRRKAARSGILAKTREHPAAINRSA